MVVVDAEGFRRLPGSVAVHRAGLALVRGNVAEAVHHARRALDLAPEDDQLGRGAAAALLGLAAWANGDLEEAHRTFAAGMAGVQRAGYISDVLSGTRFLADIRLGQGRLREAMRTYEQALQLAAEQDGLRQSVERKCRSEVLGGVLDQQVLVVEIGRIAQGPKLTAGDGIWQ